MSTMSSRPMLSRRQWCGMVGLLCAPTIADDATEALIRMLPALQHFPDYLFTPETAQAVAEGPRRLACPDFAEIKTALNAYRKEFIHEPYPALSAPNPALPDTGPNMTAEQREAVLKDFGAKWAAMKAESLPPGGEPKPAPLRDVTLKGDALRQARAAAGIDIPVPAEATP
jgi:hypothetical protein